MSGEHGDGPPNVAPTMAWTVERDLQRRLRAELQGYRDDWRPRRPGSQWRHSKLAEVVETETGQRWIEVYCKGCTKAEGRDIFHYFPAKRRRGAPGPRADQD